MIIIVTLSVAEFIYKRITTQAIPSFYANYPPPFFLLLSLCGTGEKKGKFSARMEEEM